MIAVEFLATNCKVIKALDALVMNFEIYYIELGVINFNSLTATELH